MIPYFSFTDFTIGPITIQTWGLFVVFGFLLALFLSLKDAKKKNISSEYIWDIYVIILVGMILGSKIADIIFNYQKIDEIKNISYLFTGGFSFFGGVVLSLILVGIYTKIKKIDPYKVFDNLVLSSVVALVIVRGGCFLVYDHVGKITNLPWGRIYLDGSIRHPVAIYHIVFGIVIVAIIWYLKRVQFKDGMLSLSVAIVYIILRFILDFVRCADLYLCDNRYNSLTYTQWLLLFTLPFLVFMLVNKNKSV